MVRIAKDRALGVICLGGIAVTHLADLPDKSEQAPYMAVLFCGLIAASAGLGIALAIGAGRQFCGHWRARSRCRR